MSTKRGSMASARATSSFRSSPCGSRCRRVCVRSDTEEVEELRRPATSISGSSADSQSGYLDVLTHGEVSEGVAVLERARDLRAPGGEASSP